jgi:LytS/YehU family sensor histidine kinase
VHYGLLVAGWHLLVLQRALGDQAVSRLALQRELAASTLRALRSRLHTDFLSDALSSIVTALRNRPDHAEAVLLSLSRFLRTVMTGSRTVSGTVKDEMTVVSAYLDLQRVRANDSMTVEIQVPPGLEDHPLPPLVLQNMVAEVVDCLAGTPAHPATLSVRARDVDTGVLLVVTGRPVRSRGTTASATFNPFASVAGVATPTSDSRVIGPERIEVGDELTLALRLLDDAPSHAT